MSRKKPAKRRLLNEEIKLLRRTASLPYASGRSGGSAAPFRGRGTEEGYDPLEFAFFARGAFNLSIAIVYAAAQFKFLAAFRTFIFIQWHIMAPLNLS
jgi:hypothetical protein